MGRAGSCFEVSSVLVMWCIQIQVYFLSNLRRRKKKLKPLFLNTRIIRGIIMASMRQWKQDLKAKGSGINQCKQTNKKIKKISRIIIKFARQEMEAFSKVINTKICASSSSFSVLSIKS
jgi:hypothetical protein